MVAPSAARVAAMVLPMPRPAPVTMATSLCSRIVVMLEGGSARGKLERKIVVAGFDGDFARLNLIAARKRRKNRAAGEVGLVFLDFVGRHVRLVLGGQHGPFAAGHFERDAVAAGDRARSRSNADRRKREGCVRSDGTAGLAARIAGFATGGLGVVDRSEHDDATGGGFAFATGDAAGDGKELVWIVPAAANQERDESEGGEGAQR